MRIGIDSGGTFTDCVFMRGNKLQIIKVASRPESPAEAIAEAVALAATQSGESSFTDLDLVCGTTVGTNALLERRGGRVTLVTTAGFEDVLEIGRQARPKLYDLFVQRADPLVPSDRRLGAAERLAADGSVVQSLNNKEIARVRRALQKTKPDAVALCFLFSFRNPHHEKLIAARLRKSGFAVSVSHEILPEFREFERTSTTVTNAYLVPVMSGYLRDITLRVAALSKSPQKKSITAKNSRPSRAPRVRIMQSNGGVISAQEAAKEPVRTVLSGPAGGVIGAAHAASLAGLPNSISFDMGGTSTDVALLTAELHATNEAIVAGLPVAVPMLEIHTVGAGGGSIARVDQGGALRVGPESAGAVPGAICYGRGSVPTVTDAHAVLGHFGAAGLLGGSFALNIPRAYAVMQKEIRKSRGLYRTVEDYAQGIIAVANAVMEKAIRVISVERGHDTRDYSLIAFGGAGGLHACDLAAALEIPAVLIPVLPGGLSALGILRADVVKEFSQTVLLAAEQFLDRSSRSHQMFAFLERDAQRVLRAEGFERSQMRFTHSLDMRYAGQAYELNVPATANVKAAFHRAHQQRYGYHNEKLPVEIVNARCRAAGITAKPPAEKIPPRKSGEPRLQNRTSEVFFNGNKYKTNFYARQDLRANDLLRGPSVVLEYSATTLIPTDWQARVDLYGQMLLSRK
jgi:N-methylhydantoinase A